MSTWRIGSFVALMFETRALSFLRVFHCWY